MRRIALALATALLAAQAAALTPRALTGGVFDASGAAVTTGSVVVVAQGKLPSSVAGGLVVPAAVTYPVAAGSLTCVGGCLIESPASYRCQVYSGTALVWTFTGTVAESAAGITFAEIAATGR